MLKIRQSYQGGKHEGWQCNQKQTWSMGCNTC